MKRVILHCVPPFAVEYPSPALSVLQMWLTKHGIETSILYWNLLLLRLQSDFLWNNRMIQSLLNNLPLYVNYIVYNNQNESSYKRFKQLLQSFFPKYMWTDNDFYDKHIVNHAVRLGKIIDETLTEKVNLSDTLLCGFSMKMDGWLVSSIIAEKMKKIAPDLPVIIGGINTKRNAQIFLECFPQFDMAVWGEGETTLLQVANGLSDNKKLVCSDVNNLVYRENSSIMVSNKRRNHYINLSDPNAYPDYSDYFQQKKELNIERHSIVSIEGSRGCHWNKCSFCYLNTDYKYRLKSVDKICSEIKYIMDKHQIYAFEFLDNDFIGADFKRADELLGRLQLIKCEEPRFNIVMIEVITKGLNHAFIKKLFDAGIAYAQIGYESTSYALLKKINKKNTFASNLLYVKFASYYGIPLKSVNVLTNMPDETVDDIIEAVDNLKFLRFFLHKANYSHELISVQVNTASRYYNKINNEKDSWKFSIFLYDFIKHMIVEKYHWDILSFIKEEQHHQWGVFKKIEKYYIENQHTYTIYKVKNAIHYTEFINGKQNFEMSFDRKSIEAELLYHTNNEVVSFDRLCALINKKYPVDNVHSIEDTLLTVNNLYQKGLVYHSPDYSEIVAVINIEQI